MSYEKQAWSKYDALKPEEENIENGAVVTDSRMNHMENGIEVNSNAVENHIANKLNPHKVTAAQVGLGNVQNFGLATEDEARQGDSNAKYMTPSLTQAVLSANINSIAYANSADGTDGFTTVYPNLNLLDGTKDFSGDWDRIVAWTNDGTYKGLTVKKKADQWNGIYKTFTAPKDGTYTFSAYVKSSGNNANITRIVDTSVGHLVPDKSMGNDFDWLRDSFSVTLKAKDTISARYEITGSGPESIIWTAGHKWEEGSTATPYMQSSSEVTADDRPKFVGFSNAVKTNKSASDYTWFPDLTNKVEDHVNNRSNPHGVTASQVGSYTKSEVATLISEAIKQSKLDANPIGTILTTISNTNPSTYIGGTWERFANGRTLVGVDESDSVTLMQTANKMGGSINPETEHEHSMGIFRGSNPNVGSGGTGGYSWGESTESNPSVKKTFKTGDNTNHNNWQPFVTVYFWRRTA